MSEKDNKAQIRAIMEGVFSREILEILKSKSKQEKLIYEEICFSVLKDVLSETAFTQGEEDSSTILNSNINTVIDIFYSMDIYDELEEAFDVIIKVEIR